MPNNNAEKAEKYARRLLKIRLRSISELSERLNRKGFAREVVLGLIEDFRAKGLVDDHKFAKCWIEHRLKFNPKGKNALLRELLLKGVSEKTARLVLEENYDGEEAAAIWLVKNRSKSLAGLTGKKSKKRLHDYLARRGFTRDVINKISGNDVDLNEE